MKTKYLKLLSLCLMSMSALYFMACSDDDDMNGEGSAKIYVTDAPIDNMYVESVFITVVGVEAHGPNGWETVETFDNAVKIDLMAYQNGDAYLLTDNESISAGSYNQIRLMLDIEEMGSANVENSASYVLYTNGDTEPLVTSGNAETAYTATGDFTVPVNGSVDVTADFDIRKGVVESNSSSAYLLLKPTIRLIANDDAARIDGMLDTEQEDFDRIVVFAYAAGEFEDSETDEPGNEEVRFSNAMSSAVVADNGSFTLAFMNAGDYDLHFAEFDEDGDYVGMVDIDGEAEANLEVGEVLDLNLSILTSIGID